MVVAIDSSSYGTKAGVEALIGDIVNSRTFTANTVPTETEMVKAIDDVADMINSLLDAIGYTVPVDSSDFPVAHGYLVACNEAGAAARLLGSVPPNVYDPNEEIIDAGTSRQQTYINDLNRCFARIRKQEIRAGRRAERFEHIFTGAQENAQGRTKLPMFTRNLHDNPQAGRALTE